MSTVLTLLCLCSLTLWTTADGKVLTPQLTSKIEEFVKNLIQCRGVVSLSLAVVKGNETWTRGFGMADKASGRPVNSSTLFAIGSVTKAFTATILGMLMDESNRGYTWQTLIKDILGSDFQMTDNYINTHMTVKDMLVHRTGLANPNIPLFAGAAEGMSRRDFTRRLQYLPVAGNFRDEWNYNNWMYVLAGRVAEVMGGASWEELLHQRIFQPLQMNDSRVIGYNVEVDADNFALPYAQLKNEVVLSDTSVYRIGPAEPAGAIASSADDMAKWLSFHLQEGVTPAQEPLLKKETLEETYNLHTALSVKFLKRDFVKKPQFPVTFSSFGYGLAWFISSYRGYQVTWHSGGIYSYITYLVLIRDLDIGIYIGTSAPFNSTSGVTAIEVFYYIADLLLDEDPWLDTVTSCQFPGPWLGAPEQGPSNTNDAPIVVPGLVEKPKLFEGTYGNRLFGDIVISIDTGGDLLANYSRILGKLRKTSQTHVLMLDMYGPLEFMKYGGQNVMYINMTFTSPGQGGEYQSLLVSSPDLEEMDVLLYQRGVTFSDLSDLRQSDSTSAGTHSSSLLIHGALVHLLLSKCL